MLIKNMIEDLEKTDAFRVQGLIIEIAEYLYCYRVENNFTKSAMAKKLNISRSGYQKYEDGTFAFSLKSLVKIAKATNSEIKIYFTRNGARTGGRPMSETKTPITDANTRKVTHSTFYNGRGYQAEIDVVDASVAQQLETELNEARAEVERLKAKVNAEIAENLQHLADLRGYEEFEMPAKNQLIEKLAGALEESCSVCCEKDDSCDTCSVREALQAYKEVKKQ